jgi:hypothetical protein
VLARLVVTTSADRSVNGLTVEHPELFYRDFVKRLAGHLHTECSLFNGEAVPPQRIVSRESWMVSHFTAFFRGFRFLGLPGAIVF